MKREIVEIEGEVRSIGPKALWFRESEADHDICIPLSQLENRDAVSKGDGVIRVTRWILNKLEEEGKR